MWFNVTYKYERMMIGTVAMIGGNVFLFFFMWAMAIVHFQVCEALHR